MPRRDGTGPMGYGPMTGRGCGICASTVDWGMERGLRGGRFRGQGLGRRYVCPAEQIQFMRPYYSKETRLDILEQEEKLLQEELALIQSEKEALNKDND